MRSRCRPAQTRQSSISSTSSRSTATGLAFPDHRARVPVTARAWPSPSSPRSQRKVPAWRSGVAMLAWPPVASGARPVSGSAAGTPSIPRQLSIARWSRKLIADRDVDDVAALEPQIRPLQRPDRRCGRSGPQCEAARPCLQRQRGATWAEPGRRPKSERQRGRTQVRPSVRVDPAGIWGLPSDQCGPFFVVSGPSCDALPRCCQNGPFFAAEV